MLDNRNRAVELRNQFTQWPDNIELHCDLAEAYLRSESVAHALLELQAILRKAPHCKRAHELIAEAYREKARIAPEFMELALRHERWGR